MRPTRRPFRGAPPSVVIPPRAAAIGGHSPDRRFHPRPRTPAGRRRPSWSAPAPGPPRSRCRAGHHHPRVRRSRQCRLAVQVAPRPRWRRPARRTPQPTAWRACRRQQVRRAAVARWLAARRARHGGRGGGGANPPLRCGRWRRRHPRRRRAAPTQPLATGSYRPIIAAQRGPLRRLPSGARGRCGRARASPRRTACSGMVTCGRGGHGRWRRRRRRRVGCADAVGIVCG